MIQLRFEIECLKKTVNSAAEDLKEQLVSCSEQLQKELIGKVR